MLPLLAKMQLWSLHPHDPTKFEFLWRAKMPPPDSGCICDPLTGRGRANHIRSGYLSLLSSFNPNTLHALFPKDNQKFYCSWYGTLSQRLHNSWHPTIKWRKQYVIFLKLLQIIFLQITYTHVSSLLFNKEWNAKKMLYNLHILHFFDHLFLTQMFI